MAYDKERVNYLLQQPRTKDNVGELIKLNTGLLIEQLKKFYLRNDPDALSYGYEALYNAIMTYDCSKGSIFSTYAYVCIYNRLGSYVRSLNTQLVVNTISYEEQVTEDGLRIIDMIESSETADSEILSDCGVGVIWQKFAYCYGRLNNPLHKRIIMTWARSGFTMSHVNIAEELKCTQSYVSQVIKKFKYKLEVMLNGQL